MPVTCEDIARAALGAIDTDAGLLRCAGWVNERYRELTQRARFRHLRRMGELNIEAPLTTGLATVTVGSDIVTGNATASPTWTTQLIGRHFRQAVTWYEITEVNPHPTVATLKLRSKFAETAGTQPGGYRIVERFVRLDPGVRQIGDFVLMRRRRRIRPMSLMELDMGFPARNNITNGPRIVCDLGTDADGVKLVEFYPYSAQAESIHYAYWPVSPTLHLQDVIAQEVDQVLLKAGVLVDLFRFEMAKAARMNQMEKSALYRNEMRAQSTEWERKILDAIRADKGLDDVTFILRLGGASAGDDPLIMDAHDQVYANWPI